MAAPLALEAIGIVKRFPGVVANAGISLAVRPGEVFGVLGENGAGKSTLMNILSGLLRPDAGEMRVNGNPVAFHSARDGMRHGIAMVHQHFLLIPALTVVENVALGLHPGWRLDLKAVAGELSALAARYGFEIDPWAPVWQLSVGQRQRVEILKALIRGARILILDEPTAVLAPAEIQSLLSVLRRFREEGKSVLFISHKLAEVFQVCDRILILRRGRSVGTFPIGDVTPQQVARLMVDAGLPDRPAPSPCVTGKPVLSIRGLHVRGDRGHDALANLNLEVHEGEIYGLAGVDGNGQDELVEALMGLRPASRGEIRILDSPLNPAVTGDVRLRRGVALIPADRHRDGLILDMTLAENLISLNVARPPYNQFGFLRHGVISEAASEAIKEYNIQARSPAQRVRELSGGNQQRVVLAREFGRAPRLLVAVQISRGLDVGATLWVHERLREIQRAGCAVLLISSELDEILALANRVGVLYRGRIAGEVPASEATRDLVGAWMAGVVPTAGAPARDRPR